MSCVCLTGGKLLRCYRTTKPQTKALQGEQPRPVLADVQRDMVRMKRALMISSQRKVVEFWQRVFDQQLEAVISEATRRLKRKAYSEEDDGPTMISLPGSEAVWVEVLELILGPKAIVEIVEEYVPVAQSTIARSYESTCRILNEELAQDASQETLRRAKLLAQKVTRINETTRTRMQTVISEALASGEGVSAVARVLRDALPEIATSRLPTIARTEAGNFVDEGVKQAVRESSVVSHVSVIGCKSREPNSPQYNGQSTCNIQDVPAHDVDKLTWHINHTGAVIASRFFE